MVDTTITKPYYAILCGDGGYVSPSQGGMTILLCVVFPLEITNS